MGLEFFLFSLPDPVGSRRAGLMEPNSHWGEVDQRSAAPIAFDGLAVARRKTPGFSWLPAPSVARWPVVGSRPAWPRIFNALPVFSSAGPALPWQVCGSGGGGRPHSSRGGGGCAGPPDGPGTSTGVPSVPQGGLGTGLVCFSPFSFW